MENTTQFRPSLIMQDMMNSKKKIKDILSWRAPKTLKNFFLTTRGKKHG